MEISLQLDAVRFVVVDVETTGGTQGGVHRIIEVAFVVVHNGEIVHRHSSLVNPQENIPEFITTMTGISNEMVADAPLVNDAIASLRDELMNESSVFVAHNVGFDWKAVHHVLQALDGDVWNPQLLCTCKLSRRLNAGLKSHNLASVCEYYSVDNAARHRALGDAEATAHVLIQMTQRAREEHEAQTLLDLQTLQYVPRSPNVKELKARALMEPKLREIPDVPGVYYFLNTHNKIIYVGKARNLQRRVRSYFTQSATMGRKIGRLIRNVRDIRWETTETELGALLLESHEIKRHLPQFNSAGRNYRSLPFIRITREDFPRIDVVHEIEGDGADHYGPFRTEYLALRLVDMMRRANQIRTCDGPLRPRPDATPCFQYHIKRCAAPCAILQSKDSYSAAVQQARQYLSHAEQGALTTLAAQMEEFAERLDFERAALLRDAIGEIERATLHRQDKPLAVSEMNVAVLVGTGNQHRTIELFVLRHGRLRLQHVVGAATRAERLRDLLAPVIALRSTGAPFTQQEIDELRIITGWLHQNHKEAVVVDIVEGELSKLVADLSQAMRQLRDASVGEETRDVEHPSEYSQIPTSEQW